jgi:hypothetical protein
MPGTYKNALRACLKVQMKAQEFPLKVSFSSRPKPSTRLSIQEHTKVFSTFSGDLSRFVFLSFG